MASQIDPAAFMTIGALAKELGLPQHILRYWETRFPQLRPLTRAGNRRYYRPADVDLARRINGLLHHQGYSVKGVQQLLAGDPPSTATVAPDTDAVRGSASLLGELKAIRQQLASALAEDID